MTYRFDIILNHLEHSIAKGTYICGIDVTIYASHAFPLP